MDEFSSLIREEVLFKIMKQSPCGDVKELVLGLKS